MDDLRMIRTLLQEGPPSAATVSEGRERLRAGDRPVRRRIQPRWGFAGLGLTAVAASAALVVGLTGGSPSPSGTSHGNVTTTALSARQILLAAATKAQQEPVGRYWRVRTTGGQSYHTGPVDGGYTVVGYSDETETWTARSDADPDVLYMRDLGARPLTAEDQAAWRAAGSPSTWKVWSNDHYATLSTKPGASYGAGSGTWESDRTTPAQKKKNALELAKLCKVKVSACKFTAMSQAEREKLASDPARFKELLFPAGRKAPADRKVPGLKGRADLLAGFGFLTAQPASPEVRAAAFRLMATLPGIRSAGTVKDARGRTGIALATRSTMADGETVVDDELVLDPKTYQVLGFQSIMVKAGTWFRGMKPGTIEYQQSVLELGWTNQSPHHP
jgi:hypothetical protein